MAFLLVFSFTDAKRIPRWKTWTIGPGCIGTLSICVVSFQPVKCLILWVYCLWYHPISALGHICERSCHSFPGEVGARPSCSGQTYVSPSLAWVLYALLYNPPHTPPGTCLARIPLGVWWRHGPLRRVSVGPSDLTRTYLFPLSLVSRQGFLYYFLIWCIHLWHTLIPSYPP